MRHLKTSLRLNIYQSQLQIGELDINRGIYLVLRPLTRMLNDQKKRYVLENNSIQISHVWFMDELTLFAEKNDLQRLLDYVGQFSTDIHMAFGLDTCKNSKMEMGVSKEIESYEVDEGQGRIIGM